MKGINTNAIPKVSGLIVWASLTVLMALGCASTLLDFSTLATRETARAAAIHQHFLVDPVSGEVMMPTAEGDTHSKGGHGYEVAAPAEEKPAAATEANANTPPPHEGEAPASATEPPAENTPTDPAAAAQATPAAGAHETAPSAPVAAATTVDTPTQVVSPDMPTLTTAAPKVTIETPTRNSNSLVAAPAREVTETVGEHKLPKLGDKGMSPASLYSRPFKLKDKQIPIGFIVMDVGLEAQSIGAILSLPAEISAAYSAYTQPELAYSESVRAAGHEVWLMLPTMTDRYPADDPGPRGIVAQMPAEEITRRLRDILASIPGAVGMALAPNETLSATKESLDPVLQELASRGLYLLAAGAAHTPVTASKEYSSMARRIDMVLDPEANETMIQSRLAGLLAAAEKKGGLLVAVSSRPQSLALLRDWLKEHPLGEPYVLAPASAFFKAAPKGDAAEAEKPAEEAGGHGGGHSGGEAKKEKKKPKEKPKKPLPQDQYLKPAGGEGGGHGGGEKKSGGH